MTTWTVAGQVVGEAGPGLWVRVKRVLLPNGEEMPLPEEPVYFLRWELVTTARLVRRAAGGRAANRVSGPNTILSVRVAGAPHPRSVLGALASLLVRARFRPWDEGRVETGPTTDARGRQRARFHRCAMPRGSAP